MTRWPLPWRALALPVGVAVALHALWLAGASLVESRRPAPAALTSGDDTPELLRFSRRASSASGPLSGKGQAPNLSLVPLPLDSTLPPPPPDLAFTGRGLIPPGAKPASGGATVPSPNSPKGVLAPTAPPPLRLGELVPAERASLEGLPGDPLVAFKLAAALSARPDGAADSPGPDKAAEAIARRHLKLSAGGEKPFLLLWKQGQPLAPRPAALTDLPEGVELRSLPLAALRRQGLSQPHGLSISYGTTLLLLWVDGDELWLIQQRA